VGDVEERAAMTLWGRPEAEEYFCEYLRRRGVPHALKQAGVPDESLIFVGEGAFRWRQQDLVTE
jgi:GTP-binding protein